MAKKGDLALVRIQASGVMYQYKWVPGKWGFRFAIIDAATREGDVKKVLGRKDLTTVYTRTASTIGNVAIKHRVLHRSLEPSSGASVAWHSHFLAIFPGLLHMRFT